MDHMPLNRSRIAKTFQKVIHRKTTATKTRSKAGFCLPISQEKLRCCEFERESEKEAMEDSKNRAAMEAFAAKLFATVSAFKAAYAELQIAQFPYNNNAVQSADQSVVDQLKTLSDLKHRFLKKKIDSSPPHVTLMLADIQEQQSLMKIYEITMKKMQAEIETKESLISSHTEKLKEMIETNRSLQKKLNTSGSFSILDSVGFSDHVNPKDFILVLHYALRSVGNFVSLLIREMECANWDIEAAANAIQPAAGIILSNKDHKAFVFESFVCREIFSGFNCPAFSIPKNDGENDQHRVFFFEQFKRLRSESVIHYLKQNPNSLFGKFLKSKYLHFVHPKMEFSFSGNLNQRKMVNSGEYPETEFFKAFAEMGRRVWLLHCLAFSFDEQVGIFQVENKNKYSQVYMESVTEDIFAGDPRVAFTVVPGFKFSHTVVQSQVYLFHPKC